MTLIPNQPRPFSYFYLDGRFPIGSLFFWLGSFFSSSLLILPLSVSINGRSYLFWPVLTSPHLSWSPWGSHTITSHITPHTHTLSLSLSVSLFSVLSFFSLSLLLLFESSTSPYSTDSTVSTNLTLFIHRYALSLEISDLPHSSPLPTTHIPHLTTIIPSILSSIIPRSFIEQSSPLTLPSFPSTSCSSVICSDSSSYQRPSPSFLNLTLEEETK